MHMDRYSTNTETVLLLYFTWMISCSGSSSWAVQVKGPNGPFYLFCGLQFCSLSLCQIYLYIYNVWNYSNFSSSIFSAGKNGGCGACQRNWMEKTIKDTLKQYSMSNSWNAQEKKSCKKTDWRSRKAMLLPSTPSAVFALSYSERMGFKHKLIMK